MSSDTKMHGSLCRPDPNHPGWWFIDPSCSLGHTRGLDDLRETIKNAIGYDRVPVSIDGHPGIHWTFRTVADRDNLVERIASALEKP